MRALHDYECQACGNIDESVQRFEDREINCLKCGGVAKRVISAPKLDIFKPDYYENLGDDVPFIESKQQLADECIKRGLQSKYLAEGYDSRREARWI